MYIYVYVLLCAVLWDPIRDIDLLILDTELNKDLTFQVAKGIIL